MAKDWAIGFYKSKAWKECRASYISSVNGLCERCLDNNKIVPGVEVHHKIYLSPDNINDPEITLSFENLELLCSSCHSIEHNTKHKEVVRNGLKFDNFGNLVVDDG